MQIKSSAIGPRYGLPGQMRLASEKSSAMMTRIKNGVSMSVG